MRKLLLLSLFVFFGCSKEDNSALIDSYTSQISSLNAQITLLNSEIINLQAEVTNLTNNPIVETVTETVVVTETVTVQDNSAIEALESKVAELNNTIAALQAQITSLENTQSTTSGTDNWPDYAAQGHSMSAIGVWTLYSTRNNPIPQSRQFEIKIYPDSNNPNKLNNTTSPQTGRVDFNDTTGLGFNYNYGTNNGSTITINTSGVGGNGILRFDSTDIPGIDTNAFYGEKYFYATYYFATDSEAEKIVINF